MLKKILLTACLLLTSMASQAALISHYGYERDSSSNIVKGGGLEWLKWDVTHGRTIGDVLEDPAFNGWSIASADQMIELFNAFKFGVAEWHLAQNTLQGKVVPWNDGDIGTPHSAFIELFGSTLKWVSNTTCDSESSTQCFSQDDPNVGALAFFYSIDKYAAAAFVFDDSTWQDDGVNRQFKSNAEARIDLYEGRSLWTQGNYGIALVRNSSPSNTPVSAPATFGIFVLGLAVLSFRRRPLTVQ